MHGFLCHNDGLLHCVHCGFLVDSYASYGCLSDGGSACGQVRCGHCNHSYIVCYDVNKDFDTDSHCGRVLTLAERKALPDFIQMRLDWGAPVVEVWPVCLSHLNQDCDLSPKCDLIPLGTSGPCGSGSSSGSEQELYTCEDSSGSGSEWCEPDLSPANLAANLRGCTLPTPSVHAFTEQEEYSAFRGTCTHCGRQQEGWVWGD